MPQLALPCRIKSALRREQQKGRMPLVLPSATVTGPCPALPYHTQSRRSGPDQDHSLKRAAENLLRGSVLPSAAITLPRPTRTNRTPAGRAESRLILLGLTPKDAQHDQATSASRRFRASVTGTTSASNLPCFGRQSPRPTSLPASLAISSTSRKFRTSGSY